MILEYKTVHMDGEVEIIIEKSKFIGYVRPIKTESEGNNFIEEIRTKHHNATHNVTAYMLGWNDEIQKYNDDGEPTGTAGVPVLEVIKKESLKNVAIVVTRYFGGVKLGSGGLIRAYTKTAKQALDAGRIITRYLFKLVAIQVEYTLSGKLQNELIKYQYLIKNIEYTENVKIYVYVKADRVENLKKHVIDFTSSRCTFTTIKEEYLTELDGKIMMDKNIK
ncbi:YigZ family protein [Serpentinicella sp. ANB-PHB4]|uniref:YigZ family protein n=1 Tax=Serpentinicella sp. ANB-PHB4 TaxID=3074076 RepID=UPI00285FF6BA|nr:YigZ family protein [Serpentinicella sp. ANB-PHB4]MDR5657863.1 YigZ family protein [Serpentinicella sp. ANB-PHB4]